MKKVLKKLLVAAAILLGILLLTAVLVTSLFEASVGRRMVAAINAQLTTELTVGGFDLTVLGSFPNVSANLRDVTLAGTNGAPLLEAKNMSFRLGLFSLFGSRIQVRSVVVSDGALRLHTDARGRQNFDILVDSPADEPAATDDDHGITIALAEARLDDIELIYEDLAAAQTILTQVDKASFSGNFSSASYDLSSTANVHIGFIELAGDRFLVGQPLTYQTTIAVDNQTGVYRLSHVEATLQQLVLQVSGVVQLQPEATQYDLSFQSKQGDIASVLALLPDRYTASLAGISSAGDFQLEGFYRGKATANLQPELQVNVLFEDGRMETDRMQGAIKDVGFQASFTNGSARAARTSVFELKNLVGYFERERFELDLRIENLDDPLIEFTADGAMAMGVLAGLTTDARVQGGSGDLEIDQFRLRGRYSDLIRPSRAAAVELAGALVFDDAALVLNGQTLRLDRGRLRFQANALSVEDLKLEGPDTEIEFSGTAFNLIPVLFADSLNTHQAELEFQAQLRAPRLDIDQLLALTAPTEAQLQAADEVGQLDSLTSQRVQTRQRLTSLLRGTFQAEIAAFNYNLIEGQDFSGQLKFNNNELDIQGRTQAMGGQFLLDGRMTFANEPYLKARLTCNEVDITEFFRQAENFDQEVLTSNHISGRLDGRMVIQAFWDTAGNFLTDQLQLLAGLNLHNGELKEMALLEGFSTFVNIRDLRHIRFTQIENFLEVRHRKLYLPVMFIQSNALNLTISGEHSFDQDIAYYLKVNAGQVLADRFRRHDPTLQPKRARRNGFFNLYYAILGTLDDYDIRASKQRVRADFELSEVRKNQVRRALEQEFNTTLQPIEEPGEWRDADGGNTPDDEFLDMTIEGGRQGG